MQHMSLVINDQTTLPSPISRLLRRLSFFRCNLDLPFFEQCSQRSNEFHLGELSSREQSLTPSERHEMSRSVCFDFFFLKHFRVGFLLGSSGRWGADETPRIPGKRIRAPVLLTGVKRGNWTVDGGMRWEKICLTVDFKSLFVCAGGFDKLGKRAAQAESFELSCIGLHSISWELEARRTYDDRSTALEFKVCLVVPWLRSGTRR